MENLNQNITHETLAILISDVKDRVAALEAHQEAMRSRANEWRELLIRSEEKQTAILNNLETHSKAIETLLQNDIKQAERILKIETQRDTVFGSKVFITIIAAIGGAIAAIGIPPLI